MRSSFHLLIIASAFLVGCKEQPTIEGLWVVKSVTVGDEEMTPNARWTRFNADGSQESGNGRFQHSYGTWSLDKETNGLTIVNTNGLDDPNAPFEVKLGKNEMTWQRTEEGQNVRVKLLRATKTPETYGDKVLGLWSLKSANGSDKYFDSAATQSDDASLFLRWDKRFVIQSENGRIHGVYNVHGHRPELELIPYGDQMDRSFWQIQFDENQIKLNRLNTDTPVTRSFERIRRFP